MAHIGIVKYINALPFYLPFLLKKLSCEHTFTYATPKALNNKLRLGDLDLALTSSAAYLDGSYKLLPNYCIGSYKEILSVNLYIRGSVHGKRIGITNQSATSFDLLKVLCKHFWKVKPRFVSLQENEAYDGFLLIGDAALKAQTLKGYQTIDLAQAWYRATQLPFVFALISMRKDVQFNQQIFATALQWSLSNREKLLQIASDKSGLPKTLIDHYYNICNYRLGKRELTSLNLFKQLRKSVSKVCA